MFRLTKFCSFLLVLEDCLLPLLLGVLLEPLFSTSSISCSVHESQLEVTPEKGNAHAYSLATTSLERIPIVCRKRKTKVITRTNQSEGRYHKQPMRIFSKIKPTAWSVGKRKWPSRDWCYFSIWLVGKMALVFWTNYRAKYFAYCKD